MSDGNRQAPRADRLIDAVLASKWLFLTGIGLSCALALALPALDPSSSTLSDIAFLLVITTGAVAYVFALFILWLVFEFFLSRVRRRKMVPRSTHLGLVCLAGLCIIVGTHYLEPERLGPAAYDSPFDRNAWLAPGSDQEINGNSSHRSKMLGDLVKRLRGQSRSEVEELLGAPFEPRYFRSPKSHLVYRIGPFEIDSNVVVSELLVIWFDEASIYRKCTVVVDSPDHDY